jgi:mono/diheme cytochrome c family protein
MTRVSTLRGALITLALAAWIAPSAAAAAGDAAKGKELFAGAGTCWTCHGKEGKGDGPAAAAIEPKPRDLSSGEFKFDADKDGTTGSDADLTLVIKQGPAAFGGSAAMPVFSYLSDAQVADLVAFIRSIKTE